MSGRSGRGPSDLTTRDRRGVSEEAPQPARVANSPRYTPPGRAGR